MWAEQRYCNSVRQRGRVPLKHNIMYNYNKSNKKQSEKTISNMSQNWLLLRFTVRTGFFHKFPTVSPFHSLVDQGRRFCLVRWLFLGVSTITASFSNVKDLSSFCSLFWCLFTCRLRNIELQIPGQHLKLRNLALFYVWEDTRVRAH